MNEDAEAVEALIAENARVAQDQAEYMARYDECTSRFEADKAEYDRVTSEIAKRGIRRREIDRFIKETAEMPDVITEFDEALWGSLVDHVTVHEDGVMVFTLTGGSEIKV